jgi:hypothetical protein
VRLNAELSGLVYPTQTTVLDQTFNTVSLVGRPLTIGNFVNSSTVSGLFFSSTTVNYSPYVMVGDEGLDLSDAEVLQGQGYQEFLTNYPLASQVLTGLFLELDVSGPGRPTETFEKTLLDRVGFAARQSGGVQAIDTSDAGQPSP